MPYKQKTAFYILMNDKGYTITALAEALGIHFRTCEKWAQGVTDPARMQAATFLNCATLFQMSPYELMEIVRFRDAQ